MEKVIVNPAAQYDYDYRQQILDRNITKELFPYISSLSILDFCVTHKDNSGITLLHLAVTEQDEEVVKAIMDFFVEWNAKELSKSTSLYSILLCCDA
jgi:hypothetical protein